MDQKRSFPPVKYGADVVGPPPFYRPTDGDPALMRKETDVVYEDATPISSTTTTTVIEEGDGEVVETIFKTPHSIEIQCPNCGQVVYTQTEYRNGLLTWLLAGTIAVLGGWLGCFLIPTCINSVKDAVHICPNCGKKIGKYRRL